MSSRSATPLAGARIAITRPVGAGAALRTRVRALGATAVSLPGSSLHAMTDKPAARASLRQALGGDRVIFASPAAVRFGARLLPLRTRGVVIAPGPGTAAALRRIAGLQAIIPDRADSEGMLALPELQRMRGKRVGIVRAPGGRDLLKNTLQKRGARVVIAHVYQRAPARLDRRHVQALLNSRGPLYVPLSSVEALQNLLAVLPENARRTLLAATAVASSERMLQSARTAGFKRVLRAASAGDADLIAAIMAAHAGG